MFFQHPVVNNRVGLHRHVYNFAKMTAVFRAINEGLSTAQGVTQGIYLLFATDRQMTSEVYIMNSPLALTAVGLVCVCGAETDYALVGKNLIGMVDSFFPRRHRAEAQQLIAAPVVRPMHQAMALSKLFRIAVTVISSLGEAVSGMPGVCELSFFSQRNTTASEGSGATSCEELLSSLDTVWLVLMGVMAVITMVTDFSLEGVVYLRQNGVLAPLEAPPVRVPDRDEENPLLRPICVTR